MKKLLGIVVLGLLWCNIGLAKTIVKLPKDTSSGFKKVYKSLTGKYCKDYYQNTDVPTTIVYFDEVRKGKKKEKVGIFK